MFGSSSGQLLVVAGGQGKKRKKRKKRSRSQAMKVDKGEDAADEKALKVQCVFQQDASRSVPEAANVIWDKDPQAAV